jgi:hypothetical protein
VVSRSEGASDAHDSQLPEESETVVGSLRSRRDEVAFNELNISVRVSYQTVLLIFVAFNVGNRLINAIF